MSWKIRMSDNDHFWTDSEPGTIVKSYFILQMSCDCSAMVIPAGRVGNRALSS